MTEIKNPYKSTLWGVHVSGPDTILAAHSFEEAVEKSAEINQMIVDHVVPKVCEYSPLIFSAPVTWESVSGGIAHCPNETDWNEIC